MRCCDLEVAWGSRHSFATPHSPDLYKRNQGSTKPAGDYYLQR